MSIPRNVFLPILLCLMSGMASSQTSQADRSISIIFDTDFRMPPTDDSLALMLALQSPEVDIVGITTVAGNDSEERAASDVLRMLEIAQQPAIPVFRGADMPLVHEKSDFAVRKYGNWYSDEMPPEPYGGYAKIRAQEESAVSFIVRTVMARPGEITIVAIGPLTNIARAIHAEPEFAKNVKSLMIMGGAIAELPDGAGNITPNAEFNFWVDPEAARITLRSGIPIELSPLNVSRQSGLDMEQFEKMTAAPTPLTELLREGLRPRFEDDPDTSMLMYDQIAMASLIDPTLVKTQEMYVDVNDNHDISYGVSVGGTEIWPGAEGAQLMNVQYELDWPRFIEMFSERVQRPLPGNRDQ